MFCVLVLYVTHVLWGKVYAYNYQICKQYHLRMRILKRDHIYVSCIHDVCSTSTYNRVYKYYTFKVITVVQLLAFKRVFYLKRVHPF
jgi:hypothetical protein